MTRGPLVYSTHVPSLLGPVWAVIVNRRGEASIRYAIDKDADKEATPNHVKVN